MPKVHMATGDVKTYEQRLSQHFTTTVKAWCESQPQLQPILEHYDLFGQNHLQLLGKHVHYYVQ